MPQTVTRSFRLLSALGLLVALTMAFAIAPVSRAADEPGTISGTVTGSESPAEGIEVILYANFGGGYYYYDSYYGGWEEVAYAETESDGTYTFDDVEPGIYRVGFVDPNGFFAAEFYDDSASLNRATDVTVGSGQDVTGIDADLNEGGSIAGTVTDATGAPLADIFVAAYLTEMDGEYPDFYFINFTFTDEDGNYEISGLNNGKYAVEFINDVGRVSYYSDKDSLEESDLVIVTTPNTTGDIDQVIGGGAGISGTVTDKDGEPIWDVVLFVYEKATGNFVDYGLSDEDGTYEVAGLEPGEYIVEAYDYFYDEYAPEFYDDKEFETADTVPVTSTTTTPDIDFQLADAAAPDISVEGDVFFSDDAKTGNVSVVAGSWSGGYEVFANNTIVTCPSGEPSNVKLTLSNTAKTFTYDMVQGEDDLGIFYAATITNVAELGEDPYNQTVNFDCPDGNLQAPVSTIVGSTDRNSNLNALGRVIVAGAPKLPNTTITLFKVAGYTPRSSAADATKAKTCPSANFQGTAVSSANLAGVAVNLRSTPILSPAVNPIELKDSATGNFGWQFQGNAAGCYYVEVRATGFKPVRSDLFGVIQQGQNLVAPANFVNVRLQTAGLMYLPFISR